MTEKATAIFVAIAIPRDCSKCLPLKCQVNISFIRCPRLDVGIGGLG